MVIIRSVVIGITILVASATWAEKPKKEKPKAEKPIAAESSPASANPNTGSKQMCVYDPTGSAGPLAYVWKDVVLEAKKWPLELSLKIITNEKKVYDMYKSGECDIVALTTLRAHDLNKFVGSLDSLGGIPDYKTAASVYKTVLTQPKLTKYLSSNGHDVLGITPVGLAYPLTKDRAFNRLTQVVGKKVTVLELDAAQSLLAKKVGATPVMSDDAIKFPALFNADKVDFTVVPLILFKPLEMQKGMGSKGGIIKFPLMMVSNSVLAKTGSLPPEVIAKSRAYFAKNIPTFISNSQKLDNSISPSQWYDIAEDDKEGYTRLLREVRIELIKKGVYDARAQRIIKTVRCQTGTKEAYDCASPGE